MTGVNLNICHASLNVFEKVQKWCNVYISKYGFLLYILHLMFVICSAYLSDIVGYTKTVLLFILPDLEYKNDQYTYNLMWYWYTFPLCLPFSIAKSDEPTLKCTNVCLNFTFLNCININFYFLNSFKILICS